MMVKHNDILDYMLTHIIPGKMQKYITDEWYPVLIGGISMNKCIKNFTAMPAGDIDIKFVSTSPNTLLNVNNMFALHDARMMLIDELLDLYHNNKPLHFPNLEVSPLRKQFKWRVEVFYKESKKQVVIDTGILQYIDSEVNDYLNIGVTMKQLEFKNKKYLIPYEFKNDIPYATCEWIYIDLLRMIVAVNNRYKDEKSQFVKNKLIKYLAKFALYDVNYMHDKSLNTLYKKAKTFLSKETIDDISMDYFISQIKKSKRITSVIKLLNDASLLFSDHNKYINIIESLLNNIDGVTFDRYIIKCPKSMKKKIMSDILFALSNNTTLQIKQQNNEDYKIEISKNSILLNKDIVLVKIKTY